MFYAISYQANNALSEDSFAAQSFHSTMSLCLPRRHDATTYSIWQVCRTPHAPKLLSYASCRLMPPHNASQGASPATTCPPHAEIGGERAWSVDDCRSRSPVSLPYSSS